MSTKQKKSISQHISWWWKTRIAGFFKVRVAGYIKDKTAQAPDTIVFNQDALPMAQPSDDGITVILTAYLRSQYLVEQIKALKAQTVPPKEIWVWSNRSTDELRDVSELADRVIVSNSNFLFWDF